MPQKKESILGEEKMNIKLEKARVAIKNRFRSFNAMTGDAINDEMRCLAELGILLSQMCKVILGTEADVGDRGRNAGGKAMILELEEREMVDKVLTKALQRLISDAEQIETLQATEVERNGASETARSYDRFRKFAIEDRADAIIQRFSIVLNGLAEFSKRDPNPYLMAFNSKEEKKYTAAIERLKEDFVFYKLLGGDLHRFKACLIRVQLPYSNITKREKLQEKLNREMRDKQIESARKAYQEAFNFARDELPNTHPFALRIGLSFATMYYDFLDMPERAIELATSIHREVAPRVIEANKDQEASVRNAALPVLQELEERLFLWTVVRPLDSQVH